MAKAPAEPPAKPPPAAAAKVAVPDVVGQTLDMARGTLTKQGFSVEVAGEDERSDVPPGTVLRHFPKAGDKLDHGGKVGLVIAIMSAEPEWVTVPNVVKQPLGRAVQMLVAAGLQPGAETPRASKTVRPGSVLDQKVKSDTKVKRGTKVDLLVAVQPPSEGTDGGARSPRILAKGGLEVRQTYLFDLDTGKVVRNEDADFWFEAVTETERYLVPRNGATIGFTREKGDYDSCSRVKMTQQRIPVAKLPTDAYACVRTSPGNLAAFRVREPVGPSAGVLRISYIVWGE